MEKRERKVSFYTLGCKLNYAETSTIARLFREQGFREVRFGEPADIVVINTCTVTASADKKCRNIISRSVRSSPGAYIAVVGCYSQLKADELARIPGVDLVLGSREKFHILDYAKDFSKRGNAEIYSCEIRSDESFASSYSLAGRTRSFLKIQDGCDYFCSYCTIPLARGKSRSAPVDDILLQASEIAFRGVKEVVLTGVNIGDFGKRGEGSLYELLRALNNQKGIERFRVSSIEPDLLTDEIIDFIAGNDRFAPHFHLPLQSGCDRILELMKRKYDRQLFAERVARIREKIPDAGIGADVITGFPGETDEDFSETCRFIEEIPITMLHVFSYSDRSNTRASALEAKVPPGEKERRSRILHCTAGEKLKSFQSDMLGQLHRVLFESIGKNGRLSGFTGNYLRVEVTADDNLVNMMASVRLIGIGEDGVMKGEVI
jgi:threonylcarbamoyladenosine tRNA methylthiotransferase MtaB